MGFHKAQYMDLYFFSCILMTFQKWYLIYPNQFFADNTSIIITNSKSSEFKKNINNVFIFKKIGLKVCIITKFW